MGNKLAFSGHESFICKQFWLKKIYDFVVLKRKFSNENSVVDLGVGKNMVASLRYWGKAFSILDDNDHVTEMANTIFGHEGYDPYLEDLGTIWLLHYNLIKTNKASIYSLVYNEFRKERSDFTKDQLHGFLKRKCIEIAPNTYNENTINTDINVFLRNYVKPHRDDKVEVEDDFSGVLIDLDLVKSYKQRIEHTTVNRYKIDPLDRPDLPDEILLYSIFDNYPNEKTIGFRELLTGINSPGTVFCLSTEALHFKLVNLSKRYRFLTFSETAGNQILQIKNGLSKEDLLNEYYER